MKKTIFNYPETLKIVNALFFLREYLKGENGLKETAEQITLSLEGYKDLLEIVTDKLENYCNDLYNHNSVLHFISEFTYTDDLTEDEYYELLNQLEDFIKTQFYN